MIIEFKKIHIKQFTAHNFYIKTDEKFVHDSRHIFAWLDIWHGIRNNLFGIDEFIKDCIGMRFGRLVMEF